MGVPPLISIGSLLPARTLFGAASQHGSWAWADGLAPQLCAVWAVGAATAVMLLVLAQWAFLRAARAGRAGPAAVGVICPRILMPPDDGRFSPEQRALIRAHERVHLERGDPRANGLMAALQCLFWFNPLVHLAACAARLDQEIACDAEVLRRRPKARALYARTLLSTQLGAEALPLGARWAAGRHPLATRISLIAQPAGAEPADGPLWVGIGAVGACALAWALVPPVAPRPIPYDYRLPDPPQRTMTITMIRMPRASPPNP